jgi:hypothetical protein
MIKDSVDDLAHRLPPRPELADDALRQARRHTRAVRLAVASGATLAVAGAAAISGVDFTEPAGSGAPELGPAADSPRTAAVAISLDELPVGASPAVPWLADGALHMGDSQVPFDVDVRFLGSLQRVEGGYLAAVTPDAEPVGSHEHPLYFVADDGTATVLADGWVPGGARTSSDGSLIAWAAGDWDAEFADEDSTTTLTVADATTGDVLHERLAPLGPDTSVVGFLDENRILITAANNSYGGVYVWDVAADTVDPWMDGYNAAIALTPSGDIGAFVQDAGEYDTAVVDIESGQALWTADYLSARTFSRDGKYAAFVQGWFEAVDEEAGQQGSASADRRVDLVVVEARTGEEVLKIDVESTQRFAWEPDGSLVFEAWQDSSQMALVRCDLDGDCELATEPRATNVHPDAAQPPYHLGDNY